MRKSEEESSPDSCWNKAKDNELVFVLLGRDVAALVAVKAWVNARLKLGMNKREDKEIVTAIEWLSQAAKEQANA